MKPVVTVSGIDDLAAAIARALAELRATTAPPVRELVNPLAALARERVNSGSAPVPGSRVHVAP